MTTNDNPIEALRAVHEAATQRKWIADHEDVVVAQPYGVIANADQDDDIDVDTCRASARAIAATHNVMPELLAVVEAAEGEPRTNEDGELTTLALALDALDAKIREVLR